MSNVEEFRTNKLLLQICTVNFRRKKLSKKKVDKTDKISIRSIVSFNEGSNLSNLRKAKALRMQRSTIYVFASVFGLSGDDVTYLERQFMHLIKIIKFAEHKLHEGYQVMSTLDAS